MPKPLTIAILLLISLPGCRTAFRKDPKLLTQEYSDLIYIRDNIRKNSPIYLSAYQRLCREAEHIMNGHTDAGLASHEQDPAGKGQSTGSMAYAGLPAFQSDASADPGRYTGAGTYRKELDRMADDVTTLAIAWFFTGQEKFAEEAAGIICEWFRERDGDSVPFSPGRVTGHVPYEPGDISILDARRYIEVVDAIHLIESSRAWSRMKTRRLKKWFSEYSEWLQSGEQGKITAELQNHAGTWQKAMLASFGCFTDDRDLVRRVINDAMRNHLGVQIDASGMQPMETGTEDSFNNSLSNLEAHFILARIGEWNEVDYWHHDADGKGNIKKAADYLFRYIGSMEEWPYVQVSEVDVRSMFRLVLKCRNVYDDPQYPGYIQTLYPELRSNDRLMISVRMDH